MLRAAGQVLEGTPEGSLCPYPKDPLTTGAATVIPRPPILPAKTYAYEAGRRALEDFGREHGWKVQAEDTRHLGFYRLEFMPDALSQRSDLALWPAPFLPGMAVW